MAKVFEDYFSELQTDMISIGLEYSNKLVDRIFIYCSYEPESYFANIFFANNNKYAKKHRLNSILNDVKLDTTSNRQESVLRVLVDDLKEIHKKCLEFNREMPTEMRIVYNVKKNSVDAKYKYDVVYSNDDELLPEDSFNAWYEVVAEKQQ